MEILFNICHGFLNVYSEQYVDNFLWNRYHCPDHVNPAEFLADLISIDYSSSDSVYSSQKRTNGLVESFSLRQSTIIYATPITLDDLSKSRKRISQRSVAKTKGGWWKQFRLLLRRAWMQVSFSIHCLSTYWNGWTWVYCMMSSAENTHFNTPSNTRSIVG